jgi:hypothetical protein
MAETGTVSQWKYFLHEAGHALALQSLGILPICMSIEIPESPSLTHGVVTPPKEQELSLPEFVFFKMCGPASHLFLGGCQFETEVNIFRTDFSSVLKQFPQLRSSDEDIGRTLMACRIFLEKYCREWVEIHKEPISRLGAALQAAVVGPRRHELKEAGLQAALVAAGVRTQASLTALQTEIHSAFAAAWESAKIFVPAPWIVHYIGCVRADEQV